MPFSVSTSSSVSEVLFSVSVSLSPSVSEVPFSVSLSPSVSDVPFSVSLSSSVSEVLFSVSLSPSVSEVPFSVSLSSSDSEVPFSDSTSSSDSEVLLLSDAPLLSGAALPPALSEPEELPESAGELAGDSACVSSEAEEGAAEDWPPSVSGCASFELVVSRESGCVSDPSCVPSSTAGTVGSSLPATVSATATGISSSVARPSVVPAIRTSVNARLTKPKPLRMIRLAKRFLCRNRFFMMLSSCKDDSGAPGAYSLMLCASICSGVSVF